LKEGEFLVHHNRQEVKMRQKSWIHTATSEKVVKDIRRAGRKQYSAGEKIHIVLGGLRAALRRPGPAVRSGPLGPIPGGDTEL